MWKLEQNDISFTNIILLSISVSSSWLVVSLLSLDLWPVELPYSYHVVMRSCGTQEFLL